MLQLSKRNNEQCTIFEAHVAALLGIPLRSSLIRIDDGAQVILRNKENDVLKKHNEQLFDIENKLTTQGFVVTRYPNTAPGSDLLRIQSEKGLMEAHGVFNTLGHRICDIIDHAV
ncbi:MAG: hypothetical protein COU30_03615 [Candidatus Magasanikbacteria bacterium CG10_big_fil_rev_8_21_14_0_10_38_6]|uniref:Uncharacterized protein n=1 Tax=Candidatus Magasanikbacteria bacterium CG10_big_fil_rev_8_21_14_0_10_38_6 TaxID=1974647 RepID=A0A2M6P1D5_9BACT|nr:MAG: hypothetical protein COU30_03615 [Candidatus Magasanikbacteria bacterium CG10_big_fil_rev_8_21_14_0_10_38_6]